MAKSLPSMTSEEFAFFEMGVRIRQCRIQHQLALTPRRSSQPVTSSTEARILLDRLWGAFYQLPIKEPGTRAIIDGHIGTFQTCSEGDLQDAPIPGSTSTGAFAALSELTEFLRTYLRYSAGIASVLDWFEFGLRLPACRESKAGLRWAEGAELSEIESELRIDRLSFVKKSTSSRRKKPLTLSSNPKGYECWEPIETTLDALRRRSKSTVVTSETSVSVEEIGTAAGKELSAEAATSDASIAAQPVLPGNSERDQWLYEQKKAGLPLKVILSDLETIAKEKGWSRLTAVQSIHKAVSEHIKRQHLEPLPRRRSASKKR